MSPPLILTRWLRDCNSHLKALLVTLMIFSPALGSAEVPLLPVVVAGAEHGDPAEKPAFGERLKGQHFTDSSGRFGQQIARARGVGETTSCAFCGSKRLTINGLRAEHTSLFIDGLPLMSSVAGLYGIDTVVSTELEMVDIMRGTAASGSRVNSLAGAIDLWTIDPFALKNQVFVKRESSARQANVLLSKSFSDQWAGYLLLNHDQLEFVDLDNNKIAERPWSTRNGFTSKLSHQTESDTQIDLRVAKNWLLNIGGLTDHSRKHSPVLNTPTPDDFADGDTRNPYQGDPLLVKDDIAIQREEALLRVVTNSGQGVDHEFAIGFAQHRQNSQYSHGYDYHFENQVTALNYHAELPAPLTDTAQLTTGFNWRQENHSSQSQVLYQIKNSPKDNFQAVQGGAFIKAVTPWTKSLTTAATLRLDHYRTQWFEHQGSVQANVILPRLVATFSPSLFSTTRLGWGQGAKSPLSFLESQHGTDHDGFVVNIKELERTENITLSQRLQWQDAFFEVQGQQTKLGNMAFGEEQSGPNPPILFKNLDENFTLQTYDVSAGLRITKQLEVEFQAEWLDLPKSYKQRLPGAVVERRATIEARWIASSWRSILQLSHVGARDLTDYGYARNFSKLREEFLDFENPLKFSEQKKLQTPAYTLVNLYFEYLLLPDGKISVGIENIFAFAQTGMGDSPLAWEKHGDHYHLDNRHLWGPVLGRQYSLSFSYDW